MAERTALPRKWLTWPTGDGYYWMRQPHPDCVITVARVFGGKHGTPDVCFVDADFGHSWCSLESLRGLGYLFMPIRRPTFGKPVRESEMRKWRRNLKRKIGWGD